MICPEGCTLLRGDQGVEPGPELAEREDELGGLPVEQLRGTPLLTPSLFIDGGTPDGSGRDDQNHEQQQGLA